MKILVTGGAGFIGSALVRRLLETSEDEVVVVDNFTYAANPASILPLEADARFRIARMDIADRDRIFGLFEVEQPDAVMHLAAESHVDRSIMDTTPFIETNVIGTHVLLEAARAHWTKLKGEARDAALAKVVRRMDYVEGLLSDGRSYLVGDKFSVADAYTFVVATWTEPTGIGLDRWPNVSDYVARIKERPHVAEAMKAEGLIN